MGKAGAGKTSMHSVIFADVSPNETQLFGYSNKVQTHETSFIGLNLAINDCAGQDKLIDKYFNEYPDRIFSNVSVLIYVFEVNFMEEKDMN